MTCDIVVIGAGIHGAGVAQAAAAAGYRTLLLEQYDRPAQGTSSKSSKLIHGGLRYLEYYQLGLVRECLEKGIISESLVRDEMRQNHVRHDAFEVVEPPPPLAAA